MTENPKAFLLTLGCPKNEVDSERMASILVSGGYEMVDDPSIADVALVNTCAFIQSAAEESIDAVLEVSRAVGDGSGSVPVIVCGCMPSRYGSDLDEALTEAAAFIPCSMEDDVLRVANDCLKAGLDGASAKDAISGAHDIRCDELAGCDARIAELAGAHCDGGSSEVRAYAYVKISDGCSRCCAYCTIPIIRGPYRSFDYDSIEREVARLEANGVSEVVLIGQDTGIWGHDLGEGQSLATLLDRLASRFASMWIRVMYTQPESITDELLDVMASHSNICPYLDIPMQHCSESVLRRMGRSGSYDSLMGVIGKIRSRLDDPAIRTTLMVGFPGESDDDFEELLRFVDEARFDYAGVFAFSPEEGTRAHSMEGQLDEDEKAWRAEQVRTLADAVSASVIAERVGEDVDVLIEGEEADGQLYGRTQKQAPEVDGVTYIGSGHPGSMVKASISDTLMYDMEAL